MKSTVPLPPPDWSVCEAVIKRFEQAWNADQPPELQSFLDSVPGESPTELLIELVHVDLEFRWRSGQQTPLENYIKRFPILAEPPFLLDLIRTERALRHQHEQTPIGGEYQSRFPEHRDAIHELFAEPPSTLTPTRNGTSARMMTAGTPSIRGYQIVGELGRGGMGVVYRAIQPALNRTVAIKTLGTIAGEVDLERFRRETEAIAALDHPHIVPIYEVGEWTPDVSLSAMPYFVMKWFPGKSLADRPFDKRMDFDAVAKLTADVARAVHHAHQRGILHRDLKPANVLLDENGDAHVADFGLAVRFDPASPQSLTAAVIGTPAYMAPEQACTPSQVTTAADVYGLGAILYQLLTGKAPFIAEGPLATLELVANQPPERPTRSNPNVPRDLEVICLKCLEKVPARRYATADALADDLDRWRKRMPILARPAPVWEYAFRWGARHPFAAALFGLTAIAIIVSIITLTVSNARIRKKEAETAAARDDLSIALQREQRQLYNERVASVGRLYATNQLPQAWALLDECPPELRGWEWRYLDSLRRDGPKVLAGHTETVSSIVFLADGRLASSDLAGKVRVWKSANGQAQRVWSGSRGSVAMIAAHPKRPLLATAGGEAITVWNVDVEEPIRKLPGGTWVAFSPDGAWCATGGFGPVSVWDTTNWERKWQFTEHRGQVYSGTFSPDSSRVIYTSADRLIRTCSMQTGMPIGVPWNSRAPITGMSYSDDGKSLLMTEPSRIAVVDPATGTPRRPPLESSRRPRLAVAPKSRRFATTGTNNEVMIWNVDEATPIRTVRGHAYTITALAFNAGGERLAAAGLDRTIRVWDATRDVESSRLVSVDESMGTLIASPDGSRICIAPRPLSSPESPSARVLDASTGSEICRFAGVGGIAFHPDGKTIAGGLRRGGLTLWNSATGEQVRSLRVSGPAVSKIVFTPDGKHLLESDLSGVVRLWDAETWAPPIEFAPGKGKGPVYSLAVSLNGDRVCIGWQEIVEVWNFASRMPIKRLAGRGALAAEFSPDGARLAVADRDHQVRVFDSATLRQTHTLPHPGGAEGVAFNADGTRLATGGADHALRVWDVELGKEVLSLPGTRSVISAVIWVRQTDQIIAMDDAVRVWSPQR